MEIEKDVIAMPKFWVGYIVNCDDSGMTEEEVSECDDFLSDLYKDGWRISCPEGEGYFGNFNGMGCDLLDYPIYRTISRNN